MEPLSTFFAGLLIAKVADELAAKSDNPLVKKYLGFFSYLAKIYTKVRRIKKC